MKCRICGKKGSFPKARRVCKKCILKRVREWNHRNPEMAKARRDRWVAKNPKKILEYRLRAQGFAEEHIQKALIWDGGKCECCGKSLKKYGQGGDDAVVDHNHKTGEFRGIICGICNRVLGFVQDNEYTLRLQAAYVRGERQLFF